MNVADYYANAVRQSLVDVGIFPTYDFDLDPGLDVYEKNTRAALTELIQELDRTDLAAVFRAVRFLAQSPRSFALPAPTMTMIDCDQALSCSTWPVTAVTDQAMQHTGGSH